MGGSLKRVPKSLSLRKQGLGRAWGWLGAILQTSRLNYNYYGYRKNLYLRLNG